MVEIIEKREWMSQSQKELIDDINFNNMYRRAFNKSSSSIKGLK